jgi:hypothetical protein
MNDTITYVGMDGLRPGVATCEAPVGEVLAREPPHGTHRTSWHGHIQTSLPVAWCVGLDVHRETVAVALPDGGGRGDVRAFGQMRGIPKAI